MASEAAQNACINRFSLLFVAHEVDVRLNGRRLSSFVQGFANDAAVPFEHVKQDLKNCTMYEQLLLKAGPGILLILGDNMNTW